ncbi:MAG: NAD-dependent epimerase/dehydratase family protein [Rhodoferax sp.]|nr:NAD-dependent epimerase/dehydratase family protein [Rhodoferax sp.]
MTNILAVTGANGFVGRALCAEAVKRGMVVRGITRSPCILPPGVENVVVGNVDGDTQWAQALAGCDVVVHLAARVHIMHDKSRDPLAEFRRVNTQGTIRLAQCAVEAGVRRLVNVSSIGVNGPSTRDNLEFTDQDVPDPHNPYSLSKWEAEQALQRIALQGQIEVVTVRPPLIYGPGVGGNFLRLLGAVYRGIPLPLGMTRNFRDLLFVGNLADFLIVCASHPAAPGNTYLVSDGTPVSTHTLLRGLARALGVKARLFPVPPFLLQTLGNLTGYTAEFERLLSSLRVDSGKVCRELGWYPPFTLRDGLQATADWYRTERRQ